MWLKRPGKNEHDIRPPDQNRYFDCHCLIRYFADISPILDAHTLALVCRDLGLTGRVEAKIGIGSVMAAIAGLVAGTFISIASVPIGIAIGVGLIAGWGLEWLDKKYRLTEKLVSTLEKLGDQMAEVQALSKLGQYRGQEYQFIGQAKLRETMQSFR